MSENKPPQLIMVCGPNGAGKSTLTGTTDISKNYPIVDADKIAKDKGLGPVDAGKEASRQIKEHLEHKQSFVRESTLTANYDFKLMEEAKQKGYQVSLIYVGLDSTQRSMDRVESRHSLGGHDVPKDDLIRRYDRSMDNLPKAIKSADNVLLFDNSGQKHTQIAKYKNGELVAEYSSPKWFEKVKEKNPELAKQMDFKNPELKAKYEGKIVGITEKHYIQAVNENGKTVNYQHSKQSFGSGTQLKIGDNVSIKHMSQNTALAVQMKPMAMNTPGDGFSFGKK